VERIIIKTDRIEPDQELLTLFASINLLFPECDIRVLSTTDPSWEGNGDILPRDIVDD